MIIFSPKNIWESRRLYFKKSDFYKTRYQRYVEHLDKLFIKIKTQKDSLKPFHKVKKNRAISKIKKRRDFLRSFYKLNTIKIRKKYAKSFYKSKIRHGISKIKTQKDSVKSIHKLKNKRGINKIKKLKNFAKFSFSNKSKVKRNFVKIKNVYKNTKTIRKARVFETCSFNNNFVFSKNILFLKKLFSMFIKNGLKVKVINFFMLFVNYIKNKFKYFNKNIVINIYLYQLTSNILPVFNTIPLTRRGEKIKLPWLLNKKLKLKKLVSISSNWIKKSVLLRTEKTLFLKILSELESIRFGRSNSITLKKEYYRNFYKNKYFLRYLKKKNWI